MVLELEASGGVNGGGVAGGVDVSGVVGAGPGGGSVGAGEAPGGGVWASTAVESMVAKINPNFIFIIS